MPKKRYQDPKLETRKDVSRPYYFVRAVVPVNRGEGKVGKRLPHHIGFIDQMTRQEAEFERRKYLELVNGGAMLVRAQARFGDIVRRYRLTRMQELGAAARARYGILIDKHILPEFGDVRLCDLDRERIEAWLARKAEPRDVDGVKVAGLGWWSRMGLKGVLQSIFKAASDWHIWEGESPATGVRIGRKRLVREKKILSADQFRRLLAALPPIVRFMILIGFGTSLRISEILGLKWRDIDFEHETLTVNRRWHRGDIDEPKNEPSRRTRQLGPLLGDFRALYPGPQAADAFIFAGPDGNPPDDRDVLREALRPAAKAIGAYFQGFGFHTFRRLYVSWRPEAGATPMEVMKGAGHSKMDTVILYTITDAEREKQQMFQMFDRIMELKEGPKQ